MLPSCTALAPKYMRNASVTSLLIKLVPLSSARLLSSEPLRWSLSSLSAPTLATRVGARIITRWTMNSSGPSWNANLKYVYKITLTASCLSCRATPSSNPTNSLKFNKLLISWSKVKSQETSPSKCVDTWWSKRPRAMWSWSRAFCYPRGRQPMILS